MAFEPLIGRKGRLRGDYPAAITLNFKLGRIVFLSKAYQDMENRFGQEVRYVQILTDTAQPHLFLIQPCSPNVRGALRVDLTPGSSPSISAGLLFSRLAISREEDLRRVKITWNENHQGWLVDVKDEV